MYLPHASYLSPSHTRVSVIIRCKTAKTGLVENTGLGPENRPVFHTPRFSYGTLKTVICTCSARSCTLSVVRA